MIFTHFFTRFAAAVLLCSFTTSACMSTQQSEMGIGLGIAGVGLGTGLAYANGSSQNPEPAVVVFGGLISLAGYVAALAGAGSLGPNRRLDELEVMSGGSAALSGFSSPAPSPPAMQPTPLPPEWFGFADALRSQQNDFLLERRAVQAIGEDPFVLVRETDGCPESYAELRRIMGNLTDGRLAVCRLMEEVQQGESGSP